MSSCLCALALALAHAAPAANGRNLLDNPSFEQGTRAWTLWHQFPGQSKGDVDPATAKFGRASFRVDNPGQGGANLFSANVPCEPGKPYTISVYVRTEGVAKAGITAWAVAEDGKATLTHGIGGAVRLPTDEFPVFTRFRHMFITPPDCRFVRAHLTCNHGTVWWDAVQIEPGAGRNAGPYEDAQVLAGRRSVAVDAPRNLLPNSSFGTGTLGWLLWQRNPGESTAAVQETPEAVRGRAYHIANTGTKGSNFFNDGVPCEPGKSYTLSVYVKSRAGRRVEVAGWALDTAGKTISYAVDGPVPVPPTTDGFIRIAKTFTAPENAARLRAHLICNGGQVWWAAVQLEASREATAYVDGPALSRHTEEAVAYAKAIVREARARDLMDQTDRLSLYRGSQPASGQAARAALAAAAEGLQVHHQVPDYAHIDYAAVNAQLARAEAALTAAFTEFTGAQPSHEPWRPTLKPHVSKQELEREIIIFPIMSYEVLHGKTNWDVIEPFGWRAISWMHSRGLERPDGRFDFTEMVKRVETLREHGYHTVFELTPNVAGMQKRLEEECGEDLYFHNCAGDWSPRAHCHNVINLWHPSVQRGYADYFRAMGEAIRDVPYALAYELINEPAMNIQKPREGGDRYDWDYVGPGGYSKQARAAWAKWLQARYGTTQRLNAKWGTRYGEFSQVEPPTGDDPKKCLAPPLPTDSRTRHPVAAYVDFCRFRAQSHTQFFASLLDALHDGDPVHAVMPEFCGLQPDRKEAGLDYLDMNGSASWDFFGTHDWPGDRPAVLSLYAASMNRYARRPHWEDEFIWSQWERKGTPEPVMRAAAERNLWRQLAYGKRGIILFNLSNEWAHTKPRNWNNSILNVEADYQIPRYSTGIFPVIERKATALKQAVIDTQLTNQGLAILRPTTSSYASAPDHWSRNDATAIAGQLLVRHWMPLFVPEECILDGREDLAKLRVIIAPYATHAATGLEDKLLDWVRAGGTLICSGPFGLFDEFGAPAGKLMRAAFGIEQLDYDADKQAWQITKQASSSTSTDLGNGMFETRMGKGKVWLSLAPLHRAKALDSLHAPLAEAFPTQPITCEVVQKLELILRNTDAGETYLFATNLDPRNRVDTTVLLPGRCGDVVDLCIERGTKVPVDRDALSVRIPLHLGPGKGVVFSLGKWQRLTAQDGRKLHERLEAERQDRAAVLLRKIEAPAADPALAARRRTALAVARMAAKAADFGLVEHYARQGDALPPGSATTAVPRQSSPPRIDGDVSEWPPAHWHALPATRAVVGKADNGRDLSARFALCRVDQSVFLAVTVRDDVVRNEQPPATLWQEDGLEVFFDFMADGDATAGKYGYDDFQFFLGVNGSQHAQTKLPSAAADFAVRKTADGYAIEAAFRLDALGVAVARGTAIGFDLSIDDADAHAHRECQLAWRGTASNWLDTRTLARVVFE